MSLESSLTANPSRLIAAMIGAGVLGTAAFMMTPAGSFADQAPADDERTSIGDLNDRPQPVASPGEQIEGPILGRLIGRRHRVTIESTAEGPRYWLYHLNGELIAPRLSADELRSLEPTLDLQGIHADDAGLAPTGADEPLPFDSGTPLMLVDDPPTDW
ncbi:MAG: hypothetical protein ACF8SC_06285 [Phycisphaerales bacterium JB037]